MDTILKWTQRASADADYEYFISIDDDDPKYDLLYSVEEVNKLVLAGIPFREAYQMVGKQIENGDFKEISKELNHIHLGSIGNLGLAEIGQQKNLVWSKFGFEKVNEAIKNLLA
jgi:argininosuccinate lyase